MIAYQSNIASEYEWQDDTLYCGDTPFSGTIKKETKDSFSEHNYLNGKLHGIQKTYYITGELKKASIFTNGLENGRRVEYYPCGGKKLNANFIQGVQDGIVEEWEENGLMKSRKTYYKGKLIAIMANP